MCGVIGYDPLRPSDEASFVFQKLLQESRVRGMHSYGIARPGFHAKSSSLEVIMADFDPMFPTIAHARYSTSGDWHNAKNNQPLIIKVDGDSLSLAFNGVIHMGTKTEFEAEYDVKCDSENDGEVFLRKIEKGLTGRHSSRSHMIVETARTFIENITGSFAGVWLDGHDLYAGRNSRRPLWVAEEFGGRWYASTADIFKRAGFSSYEPMMEGVDHKL